MVVFKGRWKYERRGEERKGERSVSALERVGDG